MKTIRNPRFFSLGIAALAFFLALPAGLYAGDAALDEKVKSFLARTAGTWYDMNVPEVDGRALYDLVVQNRYQKALEIGTSTGRSGIYIAWGLSKTGGRLITIEIDPSRHRQALANFKEAGLSEFIDARLADAHSLVKELPGPFDFVFCDADKDWYKNYFVDVLPKLTAGGRFAAHNVSGRRGWGTGEFYEYVTSLSSIETTLSRAPGSSLCVSLKKAK